MKFVCLLGISIKRIRSKAALSLLLILSFALTIGIMVCVPVFSDAVGKRMVQEEISIRTQTMNSPIFPLRLIARYRPGGTMSFDEAAYAQQWFPDMLKREIGVPIKSLFVERDSAVYYLQPGADNLRYDKTTLDASPVAIVDGMEEQIETAYGAPLGHAEDEGQLNVWLERRYYDETGFQIGEVYRLINPRRRRDEPVLVRIAGVFQAIDPESDYWYRHPERLFDAKLVTTMDQARPYFAPTGAEATFFNVWYYVLDDTRMNLGHADHYIQALDVIERELAKRLPMVSLDLSPRRELSKGYERKVGLEAVLFGLSVPLMGLLLYFMVSVSSMVARFQRQEVATLASRGTERRHITVLTLMEALLVVVAALPLGIVIGLFLAQVMTYAQEFLGFGLRDSLDVYVASIDQRLVAVGMAIAVVSRLIPSLAAARFTIVTFERWSARRSALIGSIRALFIGLLIAATVYSFRRLVGIGSMGLIGIEPDDPTFDPLLLLAPSLFLITAPVVAAELFALLMRPFAFLGKSLRSATGFLGFVSLGREGGQYRTPVFMLVLCLTLGVFFASLAKSADTWMLDRRRYEIGADLGFQPRDMFDLVALGFSNEGERNLQDITVDKGQSALSTTALGDSVETFLLPIDTYRQIDGVEHAARVGEYETSILLNQRLPKGRMLAVDRPDFGNVTYFRDDYARHSFGELMNRLGMTPNGILMPAILADSLQVTEGDDFRVRIMLAESTSHVFRFTVAGTFDYFPTMSPEESYLLVTNLSHLETEAGVGIPWGVWMRLAPDADTERILSGVWSNDVVPIYPEDLYGRLSVDRSRLERRGMLGMLSVCFLAGAVLAGLGLLIYSLASMLGRSFRFSIWQALGLRRSEVMAVVSLEYLVTLLYGVAVGTLAGIAAARLYVPLFRLTDSREIPIPPYLPMVDWNGASLMSGGMALALVVIEAIILYRLARTRVFEVLRMGTRE